jgi:hypothetical protein
MHQSVKHLNVRVISARLTIIKILFNLVTARFIDCQVNINGTYLDIDVSFRETWFSNGC